MVLVDVLPSDQSQSASLHPTSAYQMPVALIHLRDNFFTRIFFFTNQFGDILCRILGCGAVAIGQGLVTLAAGTVECGNYTSNLGSIVSKIDRFLII